MQILSIRLKNIKAHRSAEFHFAPGINVLSGPNGAGKSTLFEAVGYALFGVDARDFVGRAERFITLGEKRGEIAVTFRATDGALWRATRTVGANARWLLARGGEGDFEVEEHSSASETEERLREILGLDRGRPLAEQFRQVVGPLQHDFLGPFILKGAKRQEAFDQILGIDAWRRTFEGTRDLARAVQQRIEKLDAEISIRREQIAALPEKKAERESHRRLRDEKEQRLRDRSALRQEREKALQEQEGRRSALEKVCGEVKILGDRLENGRQRIAEQHVRVEEAQKSAQVVKESRAGKDAFEAAEIRLKELRLQEANLRAVERALTLLEKEHLTLQGNAAHEEREIASQADQLRKEAELLAHQERSLHPSAQQKEQAVRLPELRKALEACRSEVARTVGRRDSLGEGREKLSEGRCPFFQDECPNLEEGGADPFAERLQELEEAMVHLKQRERALASQVAAAEEAERDIVVLAARARDLGGQKEALAARQQALTDREARRQGLAPKLAELAAQLEGKRREKEAFGGLEGEVAAVEKERARHQQARDAFQVHTAIAATLEERRKTLRHYQEFLTTLQEEMKEKERLVGDLQRTYSPEEHEAIRREHGALVAAVASLEQELKGVAESGARLDREISALEKIAAEVEKKEKAAGRLRRQEEAIKYLRNQVFRNVSARLSERFREAISRCADGIYRTIADSDEELEWGDGYQVLLRDLQEGEMRERTDDQLSGGQIMSAVVALRLALLQTIGARFAFFDEPTSNLDAARRENLARAFRAIDVGREEVAAHWYDQLFLISHDVAFTEITDQLVELAGG